MKVRARILGGVPEIKLVGRKLGPFEPGQDVELEIWEVEALRRHGLAEPARKPTLAELRKLLLAEERVFELSPLPAGLYSEVAAEITHLGAKGEREGAEELRATIDSLVELRLPKLLRLALSPEGARELPPEERFLLNRLSATAEEWTRELAEKFEKGEEVEKNGVPGRDLPSVAGDEADIQKPGIPSSGVHTGGAASS